MPLCRFLESNSNLNYKCVIVCSEFFQKIILRYTISDYFTEPSIVLIKLTFSMSSLAHHFGPFFEKTQINGRKHPKKKSLGMYRFEGKWKKTPKKEILSHV